MAQAKEIKQRIRSIKNTQKTTKAMELVAGAKMRKAITAALETRQYHAMAWGIIERLKQSVWSEEHPEVLRFFSEHPTQEKDKIHTTMVLLTSNRGLCGGFNSNMIKKVLAALKEFGKDRVDIIGIGKKGVSMCKSLGLTVELAYEKEDAATDDRSIIEIAAYLYQKFQQKKTDRILIAYTDYRSALKQEPILQQLYPLPQKSEFAERIEKTKTSTQATSPHLSEVRDYLYEPSAAALLSFLIPRIAQVHLYQALLESNASEHSSRMVAMKNASDAAAEMADELVLAFNRARQAGITKEIAEISAGSAAVS